MNNILNLQREKIDKQPLTAYINNSLTNGGDGGGDDMEKRIIKLEANVESIKDKLNEHDKRFDKIDNELDKFPTVDYMNKSISNPTKSLKIWMLSGIIIFLLTILPSFIINLSKIFHAINVS